MNLLKHWFVVASIRLHLLVLWSTTCYKATTILMTTTLMSKFIKNNCYIIRFFLFVHLNNIHLSSTECLAKVHMVLSILPFINRIVSCQQRLHCID